MPAEVKVFKSFPGMRPEDAAKQVIAIATDYNTWVSDVTINRPRQV